MGQYFCTPEGETAPKQEIKPLNKVKCREYEGDCFITRVRDGKDCIIYEYDDMKDGQYLCLPYDSKNFADIYPKIIRFKAYGLRYTKRNGKWIILELMEPSIYQVQGTVKVICSDKTQSLEEHYLELLLETMTKLSDGNYCRLVIPKRDRHHYQVGQEYLFKVTLHATGGKYLVLAAEKKIRIV